MCFQRRRFGFTDYFRNSDLPATGSWKSQKGPLFSLAFFGTMRLFSRFFWFCGTDEFSQWLRKRSTVFSDTVLFFSQYNFYLVKASKGDDKRLTNVSLAYLKNSTLLNIECGVNLDRSRLVSQTQTSFRPECHPVEKTGWCMVSNRKVSAKNEWFSLTVGLRDFKIGCDFFLLESDQIPKPWTQSEKKLTTKGFEKFN